MSQIYEIKHDVGFLTLLWTKEEDFDLFHDFITPGVKASERENCLPVEWALEDGDDTREKSDFPCLSGTVPVLSSHAFELLYPHLKGSCQFFYCTGEEEDFVLLNILDKVDALDENSSEINYFEGKILEVRQPVLKNLDYSNNFIFKLKSAPRNGEFVNQAFVDIVTKNKLKGFEFIPVLTNAT